MQYVSIYDRLGVLAKSVGELDIFHEKERFCLNEEILKSDLHILEELKDIRPDILIVVMNNDDDEFFEMISSITKNINDIRVIVIGYDDTYRSVRECFIRGVFDYLAPPLELEDLKRSLLRVYSGLGIDYILERLRHKIDALIENIFQGGGQEAYIIECIIEQIYEDWNHDAINCQSIADKTKKHIYETLIERKPWLEKFLYKNDFTYHYGFSIKTREYIVEEWIRCFKEASAMVTKYQMIDDKLVYHIGKYVVVHVDEKLSLEKVANGVFLNPSYVSHIFKKITGMSFADYMAEVKVDRAKVLLRDKNIKICDLSNIVGYNNPEYFTKNFKRKTGHTPVQYKKMLEEKYKLL